MGVPVSIFPDPDALGSALATEILDAAAAAKRAGRRFLLGCPGGRSLKATYEAMAQLATERKEDLSHLVIAMMDEYVWPKNGVYAPCPVDAHYSCTRFAREEIQGRINRSLAGPARIPDQSVWMPDPGCPADYDRRLAASGGTDLFLLASGASDGHVAFNPPGTALDSRTRIIPLAETTRRDNLATFPEFRNLDEVPRHGVSVGLGTIMELSRAAVMVVTGSHKQEAARRLLSLGGFTPDWPASVVHECVGARIFLDSAAAPVATDAST
jgi:glucosamine-6-phosphate deaminase